jgi:serine/threonine-protein kinase
MSEVLDRLKRALADHYRIERELGRGGMAVVLLAEDLKHGRPVAIKVLRPEIGQNVGADRFLKEILVSAQLNHPHILPLLDSGEADGLVYYVMPYVEGGTLRERLSRERQLSIDAALAITRDVANALSYAHSRGVLHRDVKPENILLAPGHAIIADFGIARAIEAAGGEYLTSTGVAVGTPAYMSPEQALAERDLDERSDLYSLACVTYEMLVGEPPFTGATAQVILGRRLSEIPRSVRATRDAVAPSVDAALARALAPTPADRFASVDHFAAALRATAAGAPDSMRGGTRRRWRSRGAVIALGVAVAIVAGGLWLQQRATSRQLMRGEPPRLAVLPLENLGGADDEPFAAGISDEITSRLAEIGALRVVSRTSAKRFTDRATSIPEIGEALNADYILEGTVRTDHSEGGAGMARVTTQLIRVADDVHVWQHRFDASLVPGDIFRVQADIASRVAAALNLTLGEPERRRIARVATRDSSAYRLYQLGRFHWEKRDAPSLLRARDYFAEAVARDSDFAEAHAGFADATNAYVLLFEAGPDRTVAASAISAARQAIALDSTLAAAHAALGFALMFFDWNWAEADSALARAIALDPEYGPARYWYTQLLWLRGRPSDALEQARQAIAVDPLSAVAHLAYARSFRLLGRTEEWVAALMRATELQPNLWVPYVDLAEYHAEKGEPERSADAVRQFLATAYPGHMVDEEAVRALVRIMGGEGDAADVVRRLQRAGISLQPGTVARWFALTGQSDSAFARMDQAVEAHSADVATTLPFLQPLLGKDPRWSVLQRRVGLVPDAASSRAGVVREPTWAMRQTPIRLQTFILRAPREAYVLIHR